MTPLPVVDVAACIVRSGDGRVLLAERSARQVSAGFWELPGGKIDRGETPPRTAARELYEEVGIEAHSLAPWAAYEHRFPTKRVRLRFFRVDDWTGTPHGREGQRVAWVDPAAPQLPLLPSNDRVLLGLGLPPLYLQTGNGALRQFLGELPAALSAGVRLIGVHEPQLAPDQRVAFVRRVADIGHPFGAHVLLAGSALEAQRAGATGVHSTAHDLRRGVARPPVRLWAVSCRDSEDLDRAISAGADFAVVSPVFASGASADRPLGWDGLRALTSRSSIPIYAHGGVTAALLAQARRAGAVGIAASAIDPPAASL